jgi:hypothetical protein
MGYEWVPNIQCKISDGKAFLREEDKRMKGCGGLCSACGSFKGVDIRMTGELYLIGCCSDASISHEKAAQHLY